MQFLNSVLQDLPQISLQSKVSWYAGVKVQWEGRGQMGKGDDILKFFIKHQMLQNQQSGTMYFQLSKRRELFVRIFKNSWDTFKSLSCGLSVCEEHSKCPYRFDI